MFPFSRFKVVGHSMEPTLASGTVVWVLKWAYLFFNPKVGDIVVFSQNNMKMVKRVKRIDTKGIELAGDNSADSLDSRSFGPVKKEAIIGKVMVRD